MIRPKFPLTAIWVQSLCYVVSYPVIFRQAPPDFLFSFSALSHVCSGMVTRKSLEYGVRGWTSGLDLPTQSGLQIHFVQIMLWALMSLESTFLEKSPSPHVIAVILTLGRTQIF